MKGLQELPNVPLGGKVTSFKCHWVRGMIETSTLPCALDVQMPFYVLHTHITACLSEHRHQTDTVTYAGFTAKGGGRGLKAEGWRDGKQLA